MKTAVWGRLGLVAALALPALDTLANSGGGETFKEGVNYLPIKPALVVNYGGPGRVKYIKAEISLRVENAHNAAEVTHHMPLVRDTLIMLISSVTDEQMSTGEGKEEMRVAALEKLNHVLEAAEHPAAAGDEHGAKGHDEHAAKDDHAGKEEHGDKDDHAKKDSHDQDDHGKDEHSKDKKKGHGKDQLISDLLFDNLVVQK